MDADSLKQKLTPLQYEVTQKKGTERPFSGVYHDCKTGGDYLCVCCDAPLFSSRTKFDSGTGWPSFYAPLSDSAVRDKADNSFFMKRTETVCANCGAHLGHVFADGPPPSGQRYCINSASLVLRESEATE